MSQLTTKWTYKGHERLVFAIDIGTTHSAISYIHLNPDERPTINTVTKWPGQMEMPGESKIPSIITYKNGVLVACGAEALQYDGNPEYQTAKWFKLHVHPRSMEDPTHTQDILPQLPPHIQLGTIYSNLLQYLFEHARKYYNEKPGAKPVWERLKDRISFVFTVPNGWDIPEQHFLRKAAINAGLVTETDAEQLLDYITEGEASVHFSLANSMCEDWLRKDMLFAVVDAGGSTVDLTLYKCNEIEPRLVLSEESASLCIQTGGVFVDAATRQLLEKRFIGTKFYSSKYLDRILEDFERSIKREFGGPSQSTSMPFSFPYTKIDSLGIKNRRLTFTISEINGVFEEVTVKILDSCGELITGHNVNCILLVGGFGDSPHLRGRLKERFEGIDIVSLNEPSRKAAAEGAVLWYIEQLVTSRRMRYTIGMDVMRDVDMMGPIPSERERTVYLDESGTFKIRGVFQPWLHKNDIIDKDTCKIFSYTNIYNQAPEYLPDFELTILVWEGDGCTDWSRDLDNNFLPQIRPLCRLQANLSNLKVTVPSKERENGESYWEMDHRIEIWYQSTKLQAMITWEDGGQICEGRLAVLPSESLL